MSKKIKKLVAKFDLGHQFAKKLGLPDPSGDALYGSAKALSPAELAQKNAMDMAKQQAAQAEQSAMTQLAASNVAAQQAATQIQSQSDREIAQQAVVEAGKVVTEKPTVQLDGDIQPITATRKKFRSTGGTRAAASVRV